MKNLLFKAFYQGVDAESIGAGNCASIALIKAAMYNFGFEVFEYKKKETTYTIHLKNKDTIQLTKAELKYASKKASFILGQFKDENEKAIFQELLDYGHLCFAVICKMAQKHGEYSSRLGKYIIPEDFETAVEIINDGALTPEVHEFLGLENHVTPTYRRKISSRAELDTGTVFWTKSHAMFAAKGYFDLYGKKLRLKSRVMRKLPGKIITGLFQIKL